MNSIPIPKSFMLMGHSYKVKLLKKVNNGRDYGEHDFNKKLIKLEKVSPTLSKEQQEEYLIHEQFHAILDNLGYGDLSANEVFIEQLSRAWHQVLKTSKYDNL